MDRNRVHATLAVEKNSAGSSPNKPVPPIRRNGKTSLFNMAALARETGVSKAHIYAVFSGNRTLSLDLACRIADTFGWTLEELCDYLGFERRKRQ